MLYEKWLLKERLNGVQGAAGSNPVVPTRKIKYLAVGAQLSRKIDTFASLATEKVPELPVEERHKGFKEVALGFDHEIARKEASRCLQCDLRLGIEKVAPPPEKLLKWGRENIQTVPECEGVYHLRDADKKILSIKGVINMRESLLEAFEEDDKVAGLSMKKINFTQREKVSLFSNICRYMAKCRGGEDELDDLF